MRYDLRDGKEEVDFTWEREWRIRCDQLPFNDQIAQVVVLNKTWEDKLVTELAQTPFPWKVKRLTEEG